jgi:antitoxin component YwqK of YwqJK toxin-antitoxin module
MFLRFLAMIIFASLFFSGCEAPSLSSDKKVKKTYFTGGKIQSEFIMDDKTGQNGLLKKYGYNGKMTSMATIRNGVINGYETGYDEEGRILWKYTYVNGNQDGIQEAYYPNGTVMLSFTYVNGIKHGEASSYRVDGALQKKVMYKNGKLRGH